MNEPIRMNELNRGSEIEDKYQKPSLDYIFHPRTIAVAGVSSEPKGFGIANSFITRFKQAGFKGNIYPLNPSGGEVSGMKIYRNVKDVSGPVDYVVSAIPARYTPQLISDCAAKGVKLVHLFSAGFSELGTETGQQLELEIGAIARAGGIRLSGPNGMGLYCPSTGLSFDDGFAKESGFVGLLAQSGRNCTYIIRDATSRGVYFSKAISYGNGIDLNESDFIEYFSEDAETKVIAAYIEGIKDGRRFFKVLKEATRVKPVIVMKAGITEAGARAAESHTAAIAGSDIIWTTALKQAGAIQVHTLDEMVDMLVLFRFMFMPRGKNISIIGFGGGSGVQATDSCVNAGFDVPLATPELQERLKEVCGDEAGSAFKNPFDLWPKAGEKGIEAAIELVAGWDKTDLLLVHIQFDINPANRERLVKTYMNSLTKLAQEICHKTIVVLDFIITAEAKKLALEIQKSFAEAGFSVFPSSSRVAAALSRFIHYNQR
jgi:acyl-CoA synthetase (NDP forming)